ncbi:MAG: very short patch repair endonuclease [Frankiaceae bacterium]
MTPPGASSPAVRKRMQATRRRDTRPEIAVRSALHRRGLRFNVDACVEPLSRRRRVDVVFPRRKVALFVDGCFFHRCPVHGTEPAANSHYWGPKLDRNVARDRETDELLAAAGWRVLRFWEHEDPEDVAERVTHLLRGS